MAGARGSGFAFSPSTEFQDMVAYAQRVEDIASAGNRDNSPHSYHIRQGRGDTVDGAEQLALFRHLLPVLIIPAFPSSSLFLCL